MKNPVLLTGLPRSGTTLAVKLLNDIPNVVALNEPMPVSEMAGLTQSELHKWIDQYTTKAIELLLTEGKAPTKHQSGEFIDNSFTSTANKQGLRNSQVKQGLIDINKKINSELTLAIKHNGAFTAAAHHLVGRYRCFAIIRNPLPVLLSWQTVNIPVNRGRIPVAETIDRNLNKSLDKIGDTLDRQIYILNWFFDRFLTHFKQDHILKYENVISTGGICLNKIVPETRMAVQQLDSRNTNKIYNRDLVDILSEKLLSTGGAFGSFYDPESVRAIQSEIKSN